MRHPNPTVLWLKRGPGPSGKRCGGCAHFDAKIKNGEGMCELDPGWVLPRCPACASYKEKAVVRDPEREVRNSECCK